MDDVVDPKMPPAASASTGQGHGMSIAGLGIAKLLTRGLVEEEYDDEEDDDKDSLDEHPSSFLIPRGAPAGCLTVHVKHCRDFKITTVIKKGTQSFIRLSVGTNVKCTMLQPYKDPKAGRSKFPLNFNEWKYFSVKIPKDSDISMGVSDAQRLAIELIFFEHDTKVPKLIGKTYIKLLDILKKMTVSHQVDLKLNRQAICKLDLEIVIPYGAMGYGYSHQLKHPTKSLAMMVERSLFLRCLPPEDRKDFHFNVITPKPVPYTDFIGALVQREAEGPNSKIRDLPTFCPLVVEMLQKRNRLLYIHETMEEYESSEAAVQYLEKLVLKKGPRTHNPCRMNKRFKVLSKWRKKAIIIPKLLNFGGCSESAQPRAQTMPGEQKPETTGTSAPMTRIIAQQKEAALAEDNERQDPSPPATMTEGTEEPPSPKNTQSITPAQFSAMTVSDATLSGPPPAAPPTVVQQTIGPESTVAHTPAPPSAVAPSSQSPEAPESKPTFPPTHVIPVLPENPSAVQPPSMRTPTSAMVTSIPIYLSSPCHLTVLEEEKEEEEGVEKKRAVTSSGAFFLIKRLSSMSLTPEKQGNGPTKKDGQEECQPQPCHPWSQSDPAEFGQGSLAKRPIDRALGLTQRDTAVTSSTGQSSTGWQAVSGLACVKSGVEEEENSHCSKVLRPTTESDMVPPVLLGAWTENHTTEPSPMGCADQGLPAALRSTIQQHSPSTPLFSPFTKPPSYSLSSRTRTSSQLPLPPVGARATPSPDIETLTVDPPLRIDGSNAPPLQLGERSVGLGPSSPDRLGPGFGTSSTSNEPSSLSSWLNTDSITDSVGPREWSLLSEIDVTPLRSGLVFSPLTPISTNSPTPTSPTRQACNSPGRTRTNKPGKERHRIVDTPHGSYPYRRPSRDKDHYGKI